MDHMTDPPLVDRSDLRAVAVFAVALLFLTVAALWATGLALLVRWLWAL